MNGEFDYWGLLAGIALFLFAMMQLEAGLKALGGRSLAIYLRRQTGNPVKAVFGGIVSTAFLQSSSVVGLMVLAFTGAGLLNPTAALGIVFGSNLGTTLTGWIVATLGFKFEIFSLSLPLIGCGGLAVVFASGRWTEYGRAVLGLGLLLMGLQFMNTSVSSLEALVDINDLSDLAPWQYLLFGTLVAAVIQSSSATMMITLSALHAGIIDLPNAAAVAIGADLGTTTTVMLGAIKGSATKKQVAAGHVLFNVVTDLIAFILLVPLLGLVALAGIDDPLYALVAFHSLFNLLGLLIFLPLTGRFAGLLQTLFTRDERQEARYLGEVGHGVSEAAIDAVKRETSLLIARALRLCMAAFEPALAKPSGLPPVRHLRGMTQMQTATFEELYAATKTLEGELLEFTIRLQADPLPQNDSERLAQLLTAAREAMHCAKAIKDIRHNLQDLSQAGDARLQDYAALSRSTMSNFLDDAHALRATEDQPVEFSGLADMLRRIEVRHTTFHEQVYADVREDRVDERQVSTLLNVNRELLTAQRSLTLALGGYHLERSQVEELERLTS